LIEFSDISIASGNAYLCGMKPMEKYSALLTACEARIADFKSRTRRLAFLRTIVFLAGAAAIYALWDLTNYAWLTFFFSLAGFLVLVRRHAAAKEDL
jgi:hypothetical protein